MNRHINFNKNTGTVSLFPNAQRYAHIFGRLSPLSIMLETIGMQVFFVVDACYCKSETDDLKDAILFYYPPQIPENQACSLCGQLFGAAQFNSSILAWPKLIKLARGKFAVKKWGKYLFFLGGSTDSPDLKLLQGLDSLCKVFCFYHKNLDVTVEDIVKRNEDIHLEMRNIWTFFLKSVRHDHSRLGSIPGALYRVPKLPPTLVSRALNLLKSCQKFTSIIGGCVLFKRQLVATQLPPSLTFYLCHYRAAQQVEENFTGQAVPNGVNVRNVYIRSFDLNKLLEFNPQAKYLRRKKDCLGSFGSDGNLSEGVESSRVISDSDNDSRLRDKKLGNEGKTSLHVGIVSDSEKLCSSNEDKPSILETSKPRKETVHVFEKKKNNALIIHNLAQESLKKINQMEEENRRLKRKGRKKRSGSKSNLNVEDNTSTGTSSDIKVVENENLVNQNLLTVPTKEKLETSDSSLLDSKSWTPEIAKNNLTLNVKLANTGTSSQTEFGSSIELGLASPSYVGKACPLFLGSNAGKIPANLAPSTFRLAEASESDLTNIKSPEDNDFHSLVHRTVCNYDENMVELKLVSLTQCNTTVFLLADSNPEEITRVLGEVCFTSLGELDSEISECASCPDEVKPHDNISSIYLDNVWNTVTGNKYSKAYQLVEDFSQCSALGVKSLIAMTVDGVGYAHSTVTHEIYIQNTTSQGTPGIPSSSDPIARISGLTKQDQDKMGYYLLK